MSGTAAIVAEKVALGQFGIIKGALLSGVSKFLGTGSRSLATPSGQPAFKYVVSHKDEKGIYGWLLGNVDKTTYNSLDDEDKKRLIPSANFMSKANTNSYIIGEGLVSFDNSQKVSWR